MVVSFPSPPSRISIDCSYSLCPCVSMCDLYKECDYQRTNGLMVYDEFLDEYGQWFVRPFAMYENLATHQAGAKIYMYAISFLKYTPEVAHGSYENF